MQSQSIKQLKEGNPRLYLLLDKTLKASCFAHSCFIPLFLWLGIREMAVFNVFSVLVLFISISLARKESFKLSFVLGLGEVVLHAIAAVHFSGWSSGFHYFILVLVPFLFFWPFWNFYLKIFSGVLLYVLYVGLYVYSQSIVPIYQLDLIHVIVTNTINVLLAFTTFAIVAMYYQNSVIEAEKGLTDANKRLQTLVRTDPLTDLQNRRTIVEKIGEEQENSISHGKVFSIIMSDIDHFKQFNDQYGHQFGDLVLVSISKMLKSATRARDVVARWGGEEFLILLPDTCGEEAREVADRMCSIISQTPVYLDGREIHLSMTFGVAECTIDAGINECIELADKALYEGKEKGRNQVVLHKAELNKEQCLN